jgi:hypothetical protein
LNPVPIIPPDLNVYSMLPNMTRFNRWSALLALLGLISASCATATLYTYRYTGNKFTAVSAPYTGEDFISGYFTIDLPSNLNAVVSLGCAGDAATEYKTKVTDFSFSDGVQTISARDGPFEFAEFCFTTDSLGNITSGSFYITVPDPISGDRGFLIIRAISSTRSNFQDIARFHPFGRRGEVDGQPGTWFLSEPNPHNYQGLWWKSPPGSESGWGINFAHEGDIIFATWFSYDASGKAWWLAMTAEKTASQVYSGTIYATHGPAFNSVPFSGSAVVATAVGTGTLTFSDDNDGTFAYSVNGIQQTKAITREVFGALPVCTYGGLNNLDHATNYQGLWWNAPAGSEAGWGINFAHEGDVIFATWFTYDFDGTPLWLSGTATKTGSAPVTYSGSLNRTTGPAFGAAAFDPAVVKVTAVGTFSLIFWTGNDASLFYSVNGVSQQKSALTREALHGPGTACR